MVSNFMSKIRIAGAAAAVTGAMLLPAMPVSAQSTQHTPSTKSQVQCVDGSVRSNIHAVISADRSTATVTTTGPLCKDVHLYYSIYTIDDPAAYDGKGWDATAAPQTLLSSTDKVFSAGSTINYTFTIDTMPDACTPFQYDLYYSPQLKTITYPAGHGSQWIAGDVQNNSKPVGECTPGKGGGTTTTPTPTPTPTPAPVATPLYDTGVSAVLPVTFGVVALVLAFAVKLAPVRLFVKN